MKIKLSLLTVIACIILASCTTNHVTPDQLALPIVRALKAKDFAAIKAMLPPKTGVDEVFTNNPGKLGRTYYNKYTTDYRYQNLIANAFCCYEIVTKSVTENSKLDWENVAIGPFSKESVTDGESNYTNCVAKLNFPSGNYKLKFDAVQVDGYWYLLHYIGLVKDLPVAAN